MVKAKIFLGSDHGGFKLKKILKEFLIKSGYNIIDLGPFKYNPSDDYPDYALKVCREVLAAKGKGILICGSGLGMSIAANKIPGIYASLCWNENSAKLARRHNKANVLCLGERLIKQKLAQKIVRIWLKTPFERKTRHIRRINKMKKIGNNEL